MSQHPSLRVDSVGAKHRNVLKRIERMKKLEEMEKWQGRSSVFGLPKIKSMKIKVKKTKEAPAEEGQTGAVSGEGQAKVPAVPGAKGAAPKAAATAPAKGAASAKAAAPAAKSQDKGKK